MAKKTKKSKSTSMRERIMEDMFGQSYTPEEVTEAALAMSAGVIKIDQTAGEVRDHIIEQAEKAAKAQIPDELKSAIRISQMRSMENRDTLQKTLTEEVERLRK